MAENAYQLIDDEDEADIMDILLVSADHSSADFNLTYNLNDHTLNIFGYIFNKK